ncbi:MAG: hypothetical protein AAFU70_08785, partial [Planctomycetota bacterium]
SEAREALESARRTLRVAIPDAGSRLDQHEEWFLYDSGDGWRERRVRRADSRASRASDGDVVLMASLSGYCGRLGAALTSVADC